LTKQGANLEMFDAEIKQQEVIAAELYQQLSSLSIEKDSDPRVTIVQKATEPEGTKPFFRYALTAFAAIAGFFLGSAAVIGVEHQARRVSTTTELGLGMGLRVLGTVPNLSAMSRSRNGKAAALQGTLAESIDSIRTILLQQSRDDAPRVIMITSAGDREGKTTVSSHLAASLARSGKRTLLIDCDIRSPSTHAMFDLGIEPGLCEVLRGEVAFEEAIQPTAVESLMMIAGGRCDYQCIGALSKGQIKEVLSKAREQFDFIVLDGAPVLVYADTLLVGAHADAAVLSVRRDISQMPKVQEARDRLESVGIRILGVVVNGINESSRRPAYALPAPV
jgi:capsular exopolysaccharide synthesis family protein